MNTFVKHILLFPIAFRSWVVKKLLQQEEMTSEILTTMRSVAAKAPVTDEDIMDFTQIRTDAELAGFEEKLESDVQRKQMVCQ